MRLRNSQPNLHTVSVPPAASQVPVAAKQKPKAEAADAKERELAQRCGCFAHHVIKKLVGPAWKDAATKYR